MGVADVHVFVALGLNDLRGVRRDSLLIGVAAMPWLMVLGLRVIVPSLAVWLVEAHQFDLAPYYPLLLSLFCVLQIPLVVGMVTGFLILDERDDETLTALRVTPLSMANYAAYRATVAIALSACYSVICVLLSGLMLPAVLPSLLPIALVAGLLSPAIALLLAAFAGNKVEGMALTKGLGFLLLGPLAAYFIPGGWQLVAGVLPTFWLAKAFWSASAGEVVWPYLLVGLVYHLLLIGWLGRRFQARLYH
jgi:fluoroquinolone transport system permease protein